MRNTTGGEIDAGTAGANVTIEECIARCTACHNLCLALVADPVSSDREDTLILVDCADICRLSADFMLRGSLHHPRACALCAEVCLRCAEMCERRPGEKAAACAEVCRRCADSCIAMSGGQGHEGHERPAA